MLLKLSSTNKFSQNLKDCEDDSSSTTPLIYTYLMLVRFIYTPWCGLLLFYPQLRPCEKPVSRVRQIWFPHLIFYRLSTGNRWAQYMQNMIDALLRVKGLVEVKKNAINLGVNLGQLPNNEVLEIPELLTKEHNISEQITKMMWQYFENVHSSLSDGQQTRLIFKSCAFAGILATYEFKKRGFINESVLFQIFTINNISRLIENVEDAINMDAREDFIINGWLTQCSEDTFNDLCYIYNATDGQTKWQAWKDTCTTMFCIGMIYANHRIKGNLSF